MLAYDVACEAGYRKEHKQAIQALLKVSMTCAIIYFFNSLGLTHCRWVYLLSGCVAIATASTIITL